MWSKNQIKFFEGIASSFELRQAQTQLYSTQQEYLQALHYGCCYFQGYFFSKPELIKNAALTPSQMSIAKLMGEMAKDDPDINLITQAFESDVSLSFKLLRYAQSPIFKRTKKIETIKQAIVVLGQNELRRLVSLLFTAQFSEGKPAELTVMSLSRAHYCELLTEYTNQRDGIASAFLVGLLSLLDAMLDADIAQLMDKLPISQAIKDSIVLRCGEHAQYLMLSECFENGQWSEVRKLCENLAVDFDSAFSMFQQSQLWAKERLQALS